MIEIIFISTLIIWSIHVVFWDGMIFGGFEKRYLSKLPEYIKMPLYQCCICMSPYYASAAYWIVWGNNWQQWLLCAIGSMGLNAIIISFLPKDN